MIIPIKTLKQLKTGESSFTIEIEPNLTVNDLKKAIEQKGGEGHFPAQDQSLIYAGKILQGSEKIDACNIDPKKFVVLMINRAPPKATPQAASKPATSSKQETSTTTNKPPTKAQTNTTQPPASSQQPKQTQQPQQQPKQQAQQQPAAQQQQQPPATPTSQQSAARNSHDINHPADASVPNRASQVLMQQPGFRQLQQCVQQTPHLLSSGIEALAETNPELYEFISQNPEAFVSALNQPLNERPSPRSGLQQPSLAGRRENPGILDLISNITQQDKEAIGRLKELGFSEDLAAQAYMACNKDEQMAANLLFQMDQ